MWLLVDKCAIVHVLPHHDDGPVGCPPVGLEGDLNRSQTVLALSES